LRKAPDVAKRGAFNAPTRRRMGQQHALESGGIAVVANSSPNPAALGRAPAGLVHGQLQQPSFVAGGNVCRDALDKLANAGLLRLHLSPRQLDPDILARLGNI
jgi:hypothetical protein